MDLAFLQKFSNELLERLKSGGTVTILRVNPSSRDETL
jgi:hypothetical protein